MARDPQSEQAAGEAARRGGRPGGRRAWLGLGLGALYATFLGATSANPLRDVAAVALVGGGLFLIPRVLQGLEGALPPAAGMAPAPWPRGRRRVLGVLLALLAAGLYLACWSGPLVLHAEESSRVLMAASRHTDEGAFKKILERMFAERTLNPHPEFIFFNYGHLQLNLVMAPLLPARSLFADPAAAAFVGARALNLLALLGLAALGGVWFGRRLGPAVGLGLAALLLSHPVLVNRALLAQSPDLLLALTTTIAIAYGARYYAGGGARDLGLGTLWAGIAFGTKYVGLFQVPVLGLALLLVWRRARGRWPAARALAGVVARLGGLFGLGVLVSSPYHVFYPKACALVFLRAGTEYFPGSFSLLSGFARFFGESLLDLLAPAAALLVLAFLGWRLLRDPQARPRLRGPALVALWTLGWSAYVGLFMHRNVGPHLLLPVAPFLLLPPALLLRPPSRLRSPGARWAWRAATAGLLVAAAWLGRDLSWGQGRPAGLVKEWEEGREAFRREGPRWEVAAWLDRERVPVHARILGDGNFYVPERYPTFVNGFGALFPRGVGLFFGLPELLVAGHDKLGTWPGSPGTAGRAPEHRAFYTQLQEDRALPYRRLASLERHEVYALPWLRGRELLDASARVAGLRREAPRERNPFHRLEQRFFAYRGDDTATLPLSLSFELERPARPRWLVVIWDTRENMPGWYRDECYASAFRLEAEQAGTWVPLHEERDHRPDAYGACIAELTPTAATRRVRLVIEAWEGRRPIGLDRLSLLAQEEAGRGSSETPPR